MIKNILIIGGAGFIGSNTAEYFLKDGKSVTILDDFSRKGSLLNLKWLKTLKGKLRVVKADIRYDQKVLLREISRTDAVIHLAAQVAVTTSVVNPRQDFEINALGTFNVLEAVRLSQKQPILIYSSTNKVYGGMESVAIKKLATRYAYKDLTRGVPETFPLDFHSPYGCSKGTADQYVRDYSRIYGLKTVVFRQSCIYGPRQFGIEDQGWVAWFIIAINSGKLITVYGDGKQVRDLLYVGDLVRAYDLAIRKINKVSGEVFNIGGGPDNTMSIWKEFLPILENLFKKKIHSKSASWRPGDQLIYVSDISKIKKQLGWKPQVGVKQGIAKLFAWVREL